MDCSEIRKEQLKYFGFIKKENPFYRNGEYFNLNKKIGNGGYWLYDYKGLFAISIHDFYFFNDFYFSTDMYVDEDPKYLSISYNIDITGDFLDSKLNIRNNSINGFLYGENRIHALIKNNTPVYSISIEIYPKYYEELTNRFGLEKNYLKNALLTFKGDTGFYEMMILLQEIISFKGIGLSAELFYESKVTEAVALLLAKVEEENIYVSNKEYQEIKDINKYILNNLDRNISQKELCEKFFMGKTKLQTQFKKVNNLTISEFIKLNKIEKSKTLLKDNTLSIKDISKQLGYPSQSRFTEVFKESTNILPSEYRNIHCL
ncbi:helix-turn-helix transcriptional regulator [Tissierella praeacuta]|uniref:helix-turn-helix transcriptional regulator n=1 Tax=Tissierella praeacuta TaxID=43131 RepID=UPI0033406FFA